MRFSPKEVLFAASSRCNLMCAHCSLTRAGYTLPAKDARRFLKDAGRLGIKRVGFTGGEPFLAPDFLCSLSGEAVKRGMLFGRIMTNGAWFENINMLRGAIDRLYGSGYDGDICVSVDSFHITSLRKVALFINEAILKWGRPDMISIASVTGKGRLAARNKLKRLSGLLGARLSGFDGARPYIKGKDLLVRIFKIDLSPIGKAARLKNGWDGKWFTEDLCKGPGNVLYVLPDGSVRPCCGYASDERMLNIGNIKRDSVKKIISNARRANHFVKTIFKSGLGKIRKRLEDAGTKFPGKASNNCFFCHYVITKVPKKALLKCLD